LARQTGNLVGGGEVDEGFDWFDWFPYMARQLAIWWVEVK
jgi:hypothetical protein